MWPFPLEIRGFGFVWITVTPWTPGRARPGSTAPGIGATDVTGWPELAKNSSASVAEPDLQPEARHRLLGIVELGGDGGAARWLVMWLVMLPRTPEAGISALWQSIGMMVSLM